MHGSRILRRNGSILVLPGMLAVLFAFGGCAGTKQSLEKQVKELESQVVTIRAERANLVARNAALDDRLLVLETRQGVCREEERRTRKLQVVRLTVDDATEEETWDEQPHVPVAVAAKAAADNKRPVLSLTGSQASSGGALRPSGSSGAFAGLPPVPVGGDNLGVVPMGSARSAEPVEDEGMALFQEGYRAHANGDHRGSLALLARFLKEHPRHSFADRALFWRGECFLAQGDPIKAIGEWERMLGRFPKSEQAASALYRIGFAYDQLGDPGKAGEYYFKVVERHPGTDAARKASRRVAAIRETGKAGGVMPAAAMR